MPGIITKEDGETLEFHIVVKEGYAPRNSVTDYAVEDGTTFSDHIQALPDVFTVVAVIDRHPLVHDAVPVTILQDARDFFARARQDILTYESVLFGDMENLALEQWTYTVDKMQRLEFTIQFKEIRIAEAQLVEIPAIRLPPAKKDDIPEKKECGHQPPEEEKSPEEVSDESLKSDAAALGDYTGILGVFGLGESAP